jgi:hypothetical protein
VRAGAAWSPCRAVSFLTEYVHEHPDRLPERDTLQATLAGARDYGHASLVLSLLEERDRRERARRIHRAKVT